MHCQQEKHGRGFGKSLGMWATGERLQQPDQRRAGRGRRTGAPCHHQTGSIHGPGRQQQHLHPAQGVDWPGPVARQQKGQPSLVQESGPQYLQAGTDQQRLEGIRRQPGTSGNAGQKECFGHLQTADFTSHHPQRCHGLTLILSSNSSWL